MSEEILQALVQLFAFITTLNGKPSLREKTFVLNSLKKKLNKDLVQKYTDLYYNQFENLDYFKEGTTSGKKPSLKESLQVLAILKKINKSLTHRQKVIVLIELFELIKNDEKLTSIKIPIVEAISSGLNLEEEELTTIENFVLENYPHTQDRKYFKIGSGTSSGRNNNPYLLEGELFMALIKSVNLMLVKYNGDEKLTINTQEFYFNSIHLFSPGSTIKTTKGFIFYYSDAIAHFRNEAQTSKICFSLEKISFNFSRNEIALHELSLAENGGRLIGIMGGSGAGKTTLLNIMAGLSKPSSGRVSINGIDINAKDRRLHGVVGYVSQEDLLMEDLSVYQNLFFNAQLCFKNYSIEEIHMLVEKTLQNLGLSHIKSLIVGNIFNKRISGGQRKRLNIALELIREPSILFVDEPTSGLSSRDSENVMDLLKELSLKGKLIYVVIHQPSSDIFKLFDKLLLLDTGGYLIYSGEPVEVILYLKKISGYINNEVGLCDTCGNVNPEQILNIIEEKIVDEFGNLTENRKITPSQWHHHFLKTHISQKTNIEAEPPPKNLKVPSRFVQGTVFIKRDLLSKLNDKQYMLINFIEAPLLAVILAYIVRYKNVSNFGAYLYRFNDNIPAFILMSIVVALFMGLSGSAEEILKDKKILKRESFLSLSRTAYLLSKIFVLFSLSAVQTLSFVIISHLILGIKDMYVDYWLVLFSISCMANMLGLIISSAFDSSVTVYILIPLLLIPQMILSGALFPFDNVNENISSKDKVPVLADLMGSRWAFEAIVVNQFLTNEYEKLFYPFEQIESLANYNLVYVLPELKAKLWYIEGHLHSKDLLQIEEVKTCFTVLKNELKSEIYINPDIDNYLLDNLSPENYNLRYQEKLHSYIEKLETVYNRIFNKNEQKKEKLIHRLQKENVNLSYLKDNYYNEALADLVKNNTTKTRILEVKGSLIHHSDYIYFNPDNTNGLLNYRTHIFSPKKNFLGRTISTFLFNILAIWFISIVFYLLLYFDLLQKIILWQKSLK